jgi:hypothetical protein
VGGEPLCRLRARPQAVWLASWTGSGFTELRCATEGLTASNMACNKGFHDNNTNSKDFDMFAGCDPFPAQASPLKS